MVLSVVISVVHRTCQIMAKNNKDLTLSSSAITKDMDLNIFNINSEIQQFRNTNFELEKQNQNILDYIQV